MKLLICVNRFSDFRLLFDQIADSGDHPRIILPDPQSSHFMFSFHYLQHEIDVCETGYGLFQTTFKITKTLAQKKYHLAIKASFCNAYKAELPIGEVVNVIKDKPGDINLYLPPAEVSPTQPSDGTTQCDLYDIGLMDSDSFPHFKGAFINMNNSYMNVLMPLRKVVSVTVNQYGDAEDYSRRRDKYKADIETMDGLGFVYPCMYERQPFYQLCCVERNLYTGDSDRDLALRKVNNTLLDIIQKL